MNRRMLPGLLVSGAFVLAACGGAPTPRPIATISISADGSIATTKPVAAGKPVFIEFYSVT